MVVSPVAVEKLAHSKFAKLLRVRKLYKRFFPVSWTFSNHPIFDYYQKNRLFQQPALFSTVK